MSSKRNQLFKADLIDAHKQTLGYSTVHSVRPIIVSPFLLVRIVWAICLLVSTGCFLWFLIKSFRDYYNYSVTSKVDIQFKKSIPFPVVTVCNLNPNIVTDINSIILTCTFNNIECTIDVDFEPFVDPNYNQCYKFNSGTDSNDNGVPFKYTATTGTKFGLHLDLFVGAVTDSQGDYSNVAPENGALIIISNESYTIRTSGIKLTTGTMTDIVLEKYSIEKQPVPYSNCIDDLTDEDSYDSEVYKQTIKTIKSLSKNSVYHYKTCVGLCQQKYFGDQCGFQILEYGPFYYPNITVYSDYNIQQGYVPSKQLICLFNTQILFSTGDYLNECNCPMECYEYGYDYSLSFSNYPTEGYETTLYYEFSSHVTENVFQAISSGSDNYTLISEKCLGVNIYYDELKETVTTFDPKSLPVDLLSSIGGIMGLFLGASLLSLAEFLEIIIQTIIIAVKSRRNKNIIQVEPIKDDKYSNEINELRLTNKYLLNAGQVLLNAGQVLLNANKVLLERQVKMNDEIIDQELIACLDSLKEIKNFPPLVPSDEIVSSSSSIEKKKSFWSNYYAAIIMISIFVVLVLVIIISLSLTVWKGKINTNNTNSTTNFYFSEVYMDSMKIFSESSHSLIKNIIIPGITFICSPLFIDPNTIAVGTNDGQVAVFDITTNLFITTLINDNLASEISSLKKIIRNNYVYLVSLKLDALEIWNLNKSSLNFFTQQFNETLSTIEIINNNLIAVGYIASSNNIQIFECDNFFLNCSIIKVLTHDSSQVDNLYYLAPNGLLISSDEMNAIQFWNVSDWSLVKLINQNAGDFAQVDQDRVFFIAYNAQYSPNNLFPPSKMQNSNLSYFIFGINLRSFEVFNFTNSYPQTQYYGIKLLANGQLSTACYTIKSQNDKGFTVRFWNVTNNTFVKELKVNDYFLYLSTLIDN